MRSPPCYAEDTIHRKPLIPYLLRTEEGYAGGQEATRAFIPNGQFAVPHTLPAIGTGGVRHRRPVTGSLIRRCRDIGMATAPHPALAGGGAGVHGLRKLPMPPRRKLSRLPHPKAIRPSRRFAPSSAASPRAGLRPMAKSPRWRACQSAPALSATNSSALTRRPIFPWHRVVNAKGEVSYSLSRNGNDAFQQRLLENEGVEFDTRNRFDLERFRWLE